MRILMIIFICILMMACGPKSDVIGIKDGDEYYALDHAAKDAVTNKDSEKKLICRRTGITGSHFKTKRCTTKENLELERNNAREFIESKDLEFNKRLRSGGG